MRDDGGAAQETKECEDDVEACDDEDCTESADESDSDDAEWLEDLQEALEDELASIEESIEDAFEVSADVAEVQLDAAEEWVDVAEENGQDEATCERIEGELEQISEQLDARLEDAFAGFEDGWSARWSEEYVDEVAAALAEAGSQDAACAQECRVAEQARAEAERTLAELLAARGYQAQGELDEMAARLAQVEVEQALAQIQGLEGLENFQFEVPEVDLQGLNFEVPAFEIPAFEIPAFEVPAFEVPAFQFDFGPVELGHVGDVTVNSMAQDDEESALRQRLDELERMLEELNSQLDEQGQSGNPYWTGGKLEKEKAAREKVKEKAAKSHSVRTWTTTDGQAGHVVGMEGGKAYVVTPEGKQEIALEGEGPHAIVLKDGRVHVTTPQTMTYQGDVSTNTVRGRVVAPSDVKVDVQGLTEMAPGVYTLRSDGQPLRIESTDGNVLHVAPRGVVTRPDGTAVRGYVAGAGGGENLDEIGTLLREMRAELRELRESVQALREDLGNLRRETGSAR